MYYWRGRIIRVRLRTSLLKLMPSPRSRLGISVAVAVFVLIVATAVAIALMHPWVSEQVSKSISGAKQAGAGGLLRVEGYKVEDSTLTVYVRNLKGSDVEIDAVIIKQAGSVIEAVEVEGRSITVKPGSLAAIKAKLPGLTAGTYTIVLSSRGGIAARFELKLTTPVTPAPTVEVGTVELSANTTELYVGGSVKFTVRVLDSTGSPVKGVKASLFMNDELLVELTTNAEGYAYYTYTFTEEGIYTIYARANTVTSNTVTVEVLAAPRVTSVALSSNVTELYVGESAALTVLVEDQYDNPMQGVEVNLFLNDTLLTTLTTNASGYAQYVYTFTEPGTYQFYAEADEVKSNAINIAVLAWLAGWGYRKPVTITERSGYTLAQYQVKVVLTPDNFDYSKAKDDGGDLRFTDEDGLTLLSYWVERWSSGGESIVWVKVPAIPAGGSKTIYMYYGNPSATSQSDLLSVMEELPAGDGEGYKIYYQEWIMDVGGLAGGGTAMGWHADDWQWAYNLPFSFPYYSSTYSRVAIASNGYIEVGGRSKWSDYSDSLSKMKKRRYICPLWEDLRTQYGGDIYIDSNYHDEYGSGVLVRWDDCVFFCRHGDVNVEVVLYSNGLIRFNYGHVRGYSCDKPTVGISSGDRTHYTVSSYNNKPADFYDYKESLMFWPRKLASPEPAVSIGAEESP
ncbi:MAG: hypothetical protein DRJ97_06460 [Thermoprotei archaeon]|nr:MAG: hypothetical protein DRJ97_06460 [Thermoprotei archaeon]